MTKKFIKGAIAFCATAAMGLAAPTAVKADALPCTVTYLNQAREAQAKATSELAAAQAKLKEIQAKVDAFTAAGETNTQAYFDAATELLAARGNVESKQQALCSANSFVSDCQSKYAVEDNFDKAYKALQDVNMVQSSKLEYDNAQSIATAASSAIEQTKNAIAGYQSQLAVSPAVQTQIDALNAQLAAQQADYDAKQAVADSKKSVYEASLNSNYASYDKAPIDYIYNRNLMRAHIVTDLNKDGVVDGEDFFIGIGYMQGGSKEGVYFREDHYIEEAKNYWKSLYCR